MITGRAGNPALPEHLEAKSLVTAFAASIRLPLVCCPWFDWDKEHFDIMHNVEMLSPLRHANDPVRKRSK